MINILIAIESCSLLYTIILMVVYFAKKRNNSLDSKLYGYLVIVTVIGFIIEIFSNLCPSLFGLNNITKIVTKIYKCHYIVYSSLLIMYLILKGYYSREDNNDKRNKFSKILSIVLSIYTLGLCLFILLTKSIPHYDGNSYYGTGISIYGIVLTNFILFLVDLVVFIKDYKYLDYRERINYIVVFIILATSALIRIISKEFTINNTLFSLYSIVMFFTLENPNIKEIEELEDNTNNKDNILSSISKDMNDPIKNILGYSNDTNGDIDNLKSNLDLINKESNILLNQINSIMESRSINNDDIINIKDTYYLKDVLEDLIKNENEFLEDNKNIRFRYEYSSLIPKGLVGNSNAIKSIIEKLLNIVNKYVNEGFIILDINYNLSSSNLMISVKFSNKDLPTEVEDDMRRLMNSDSSILDLAICKKIVTALNGNIIYNKMDSSSEMFIKIGQEVSDEYINSSNEVKEENKDSHPVFVDRNDSNNKVLIVDDNSLNIKVAQKILERLNFEVDFALSADDGIALVKLNKYKFIFMDIMMPGKDGIQALHELRELDGGNKLNIIALTADSSSTTREKYLKEGFNEYIAKPVNQVEMERVTRV